MHNKKKQQSSLLYGKQAAEINEHCFLDHEKQEADGVVLHCQIYSINTLCVCSASAGEKQGWTHWHSQEKNVISMNVLNQSELLSVAECRGPLFKL